MSLFNFASGVREKQDWRTDTGSARPPSLFSWGSCGAREEPAWVFLSRTGGLTSAEPGNVDSEQRAGRQA